MADWLVALAQWKREHLAREAIAGAGFNCYLPKIRERKVVRGRRVWFERPLLGRYVLVEYIHDWLGQYVKLRAISEINGLLMYEEEPLFAREREVERLRGSEVNGYIPQHRVSEFRSGQKVMVKRGPFFNYSAFYKEDCRTYDLVELDMLGRVTTVSLPSGSLIAA